MSNYTVTWGAALAHSFPRFTVDGGTHSNEFDAQNTDYLISAGILPTAILALALLCLIYVNFIQCCCRFECCRIVPIVAEGEEITKVKLEKIVKQRGNFIKAFAFFFLMVLIADQGLIYGDQDLTDSVGSVIDNLDIAKDVVFTVTDAGDATLADLVSISASLDRAETSCPQVMANMTGLKDLVYTAGNATEDFNKILDGVPSAITDAQDQMDSISDDKTLIIYLSYALFYGLLIFYGTAACLRSKLLMNGSSFLSGVLVLAISFAGVILMVLASVFGDFCQTPTDNLLDYAGAGDVGYYLTCQGTNPLTGDFNTMESRGNDLLNDLKNITDPVSGYAACTNDINLSDAIASTDDIISVQLASISDYIACEPNRDIWQGLEAAFCNEFMDGYMTIFLSLYAVSFFLFFLSVYGDLMARHYATNWNLTIDGYKPPAVTEEGEEKGGDADNIPMATAAVVARPPVANVTYSEVEMALTKTQDDNAFDLSYDGPSEKVVSEKAKAAPSESTRGPTGSVRMSNVSQFATVPLPAMFHKKLFCEVCRSVFVAASNPRHHCRNCGKSICSRHAENTACCPAFPGESPKRVCEECYEILK